MNWIYMFLGMSLILSVLSCSLDGNSSAQNRQSDWQLVWSDEFEINGLPDTNKWSYNIGRGCDLPAGCGWGNNELQYYLAHDARTARVENGLLVIEAHKTRHMNADFISARMHTKDRGIWKYGRFEIKAKLPRGKGVWPAIWMLPEKSNYGGWPNSGEIDIMEYVGYHPGTVHGTIHTEAYNGMLGTQKGGHFSKDSIEDDFHTYAMEWTPKSIVWSVNDSVYYQFENDDRSRSEWPFDQPFYLLINLAVGGKWGGKFGVEPDIWPQQFEIDYVRIYQKEYYDEI